MRTYGVDDTLPGAQVADARQASPHRESGVVARSVIDKIRRPDIDLAAIPVGGTLTPSMFWLCRILGSIRGLPPGI